MAEVCLETVDPRIRRTRVLLQQALGKLLETKEFDKISVQDIAEAATVNRATFYDHYTDKYALLECMVGTRFHELLEERGIRFECASALKSIVLAVCDYLAPMGKVVRKMEPHMESAVIAVVRRMLLDGLRRHSDSTISPEMIAATASWGISGAAKEWAQTPNRRPPEEIVEEVAAL